MWISEGSVQLREAGKVQISSDFVRTHRLANWARNLRRTSLPEYVLAAVRKKYRKRIVYYGAVQHLHFLIPTWEEPV